AALVKQRVVISAEAQEIRQLGLAAVCPVHDVVRVEEQRAIATREPAAAVPGVQRASQRRRYRPRLAPDAERLAVLVVDHADERALARQAPDGVERERGAVLEGAAL